MRARLFGCLLILAAAATPAAAELHFLLECPVDRYASVPVGEVHEFNAPLWAVAPGNDSVDVHFEAFVPDTWFSQWCQTSTGICYFSDQRIRLVVGEVPDTLRIDFFPDFETPGMGWINIEIRSVEDPTEVARCSYALYSGLPVPDVSFDVDCSDNTAVVDSGTELVEFFSPIMNLRENPDSLFVRATTDVPIEWFAQFCQTSNGICYFEEGILALPDGGMADSIKVDFFTFGVDGEGSIDLEIHSTQNPSLFRWCRYQVFQGVGTTSAEPARLTRRLEVFAQPNPFGNETVLELRSDADAAGRLQIFGADGRVVRNLGPVHLAAGAMQVRWDGRDDLGASVPSGVYFYRLETGAVTAKGTLIRTR